MAIILDMEKMIAKKFTSFNMPIMLNSKNRYNDLPSNQQ